MPQIKIKDFKGIYTNADSSDVDLQFALDSENFHYGTGYAEVKKLVGTSVYTTPTTGAVKEKLVLYEQVWIQSNRFTLVSTRTNDKVLLDVMITKLGNNYKIYAKLVNELTYTELGALAANVNIMPKIRDISNNCIIIINKEIYWLGYVLSKEVDPLDGSVSFVPILSFLPYSVGAVRVNIETATMDIAQKNTTFSYYKRIFIGILWTHTNVNSGRYLALIYAIAKCDIGGNYIAGTDNFDMTAGYNSVKADQLKHTYNKDREEQEKKDYPFVPYRYIKDGSTVNFTFFRNDDGSIRFYTSEFYHFEDSKIDIDNSGSATILANLDISTAIHTSDIVGNSDANIEYVTSTGDWQLIFSRPRYRYIDDRYVDSKDGFFGPINVIVTAILNYTDERVIGKPTQYLPLANGKEYAIKINPDLDFMQGSLVTGYRIYIKKSTYDNLRQVYYIEEALDYEEYGTFDIYGDPLVKAKYLVKTQEKDKDDDDDDGLSLPPPPGDDTTVTPYKYAIILGEASAKGIFFTQNVGVTYEEYQKRLTAIDDIGIAGGISYACRNNAIYTSAIGNGTIQSLSFYRANYLDVSISGKVVKIKDFDNAVAIYTDREMVIIVKNGETYFIKDRSDFPITNEEHIIKNYMITSHGIYFTNGYDKQLISEPINDIVKRNYKSSTIGFDYTKNELYYFPNTTDIYVYQINYQKWERYNIYRTITGTDYIGYMSVPKLRMLQDNSIALYDNDSMYKITEEKTGNATFYLQNTNFDDISQNKILTYFDIECYIGKMQGTLTGNYGGYSSITSKVEIALDKVYNIWKGTLEPPAFSLSRSYEVGDIVVYRGNIYRCVTAHEGNIDFVSEYWTILVYIAYTARSYTAGDLVYYIDNTIKTINYYVCTADITVTDASTGLNPNYFTPLNHWDNVKLELPFYGVRDVSGSPYYEQTAFGRQTFRLYIPIEKNYVLQDYTGANYNKKIITRTLINNLNMYLKVTNLEFKIYNISIDFDYVYNRVRTIPVINGYGKNYSFVYGYFL